jgi:hypothetical protein
VGFVRDCCIPDLGYLPAVDFEGPDHLCGLFLATNTYFDHGQPSSVAITLSVIENWAPYRKRFIGPVVSVLRPA